MTDQNESLIGEIRYRALSLWQPWASLIAVGAKAVETRGWSTPYRGLLAIHAAKTTKGFDTLPGDCEGTTEGGWRYGYIGDFQAAYCYQSSDEGARGETFLHCLEGPDATNEPGPCPLGAVIAICRLRDCVRTERIQWEPERFEVKGDLVEWSRSAMCGDHVDARIAEDQRQYGDFTSGRYAWLLSDITPIGPVPAKGKQGLWTWTTEEADHA